MTTRGRTITAAGILAGLIAIAPAFAQSDYPNKPVRVIVPYAPGGSTNFIARTVADKLASQMGVAFILDNRPGANGNIGAALAAKATPDGYTLLSTGSAMVLGPSLYADPGYVPERDFSPISLTAEIPFVIVTHPSTPVSSMREFVAYLKANDGKLSYATAGNGSPPHLGTYLMLREIGATATHVPYKGSGPSVVDLLRGDPVFSIIDVQPALAHIRAGKLKALATLGPRKTAVLPDVVTVSETVLPGFTLFGWNGMFAPAGTPADIVRRLNTEVVKAIQDPAVRAAIATQGADPQTMPVEEFTAFVRSEGSRWAAVIRATGAKAD